MRCWGHRVGPNRLRTEDWWSTSVSTLLLDIIVPVSAPSGWIPLKLFLSHQNAMPLIVSLRDFICYRLFQATSDHHLVLLRLVLLRTISVEGSRSYVLFRFFLEQASDRSRQFLASKVTKPNDATLVQHKGRRPRSTIPLS